MEHQQRQTDDLQGPEEAGQAPGRVGLVEEARWGVEERAKGESPEDYRTTDHGTTGCRNRHLTPAISPSEAQRGGRRTEGGGRERSHLTPALSPGGEGGRPVGNIEHRTSNIQL